MLTTKLLPFATLAIVTLLAGSHLIGATPSVSVEKESEKTTTTSSTAITSPQKAEENVSFTPQDIKKLSEAFGHFIGKNLNNPGIEFDVDSVILGIRNGFAGAPAPMADKEYEKMMAKLQENAFRRLSEENLKAANAFLEKNKSATGVVEIVPGKLQYMMLEQGSGAAVAEGSVPQIKYVGKYIDGKVFGNSEDVGGPITVPLKQTIQGFSQGLVGMKEGEKRRLFVHPDLGYGTMGQLPPNALLIFDIEIVKADTPDYKPPQMQRFSADDDEGDDDFSFSDDDDEDDDEDDSDNDDEDDDDEDDDDEPVQPATKADTMTPAKTPATQTQKIETNKAPSNGNTPAQQQPYRNATYPRGTTAR